MDIKNLEEMYRSLTLEEKEKALEELIEQIRIEMLDDVININDYITEDSRRNNSKIKKYIIDEIISIILSKYKEYTTEDEYVNDALKAILLRIIVNDLDSKGYKGLKGKVALSKNNKYLEHLSNRLDEMDINLPTISMLEVNNSEKSDEEPISNQQRLEKCIIKLKEAICFEKEMLKSSLLDDLSIYSELQVVELKLKEEAATEEVLRDAKNALLKSKDIRSKCMYSAEELTKESLDQIKYIKFYNDFLKQNKEYYDYLYYRIIAIENEFEKMSRKHIEHIYKRVKDIEDRFQAGEKLEFPNI